MSQLNITYAPLSKAPLIAFQRSDDPPNGGAIVNG